MAEEIKKPAEAKAEDKALKPVKKEELAKATPKAEGAGDKEECAICATKESLKAVMTAFSLPAEAIARGLTEATETTLEAAGEQDNPPAYILKQLTQAQRASVGGRAVPQVPGSAAITTALAYIEVVEKAAIAHQAVGDCDCNDD